MPGETKNGNGHAGEVWLIGAKSIGAYVGVDYREIPELVNDEGLPAFKWRGRWRAVPEEVRKWSHTIATRCRRKGPTRRPGGRAETR